MWDRQRVREWRHTHTVLLYDVFHVREHEFQWESVCIIYPFRGTYLAYIHTPRSEIRRTEGKTAQRERQRQKDRDRERENHLVCLHREPLRAQHRLEAVGYHVRFLYTHTERYKITSWFDYREQIYSLRGVLRTTFLSCLSDSLVLRTNFLSGPSHSLSYVLITGGIRSVRIPSPLSSTKKESNCLFPKNSVTHRGSSLQTTQNTRRSENEIRKPLENRYEAADLRSRYLPCEMIRRRLAKLLFSRFHVGTL